MLRVSRSKAGTLASGFRVSVTAQHTHVRTTRNQSVACTGLGSHSLELPSRFASYGYQPSAAIPISSSCSINYSGGIQPPDILHVHAASTCPHICIELATYLSISGGVARDQQQPSHRANCSSVPTGNPGRPARSSRGSPM